MTFFGKLFSKQEEPIKIGHLTPLTGNLAKYGQLEVEGTDLALEEINKKGGINGRKVAIAREDDQGDPEKSVMALNKLIYTDKVKAAVGPISSGAVIADAPIAEKNRVVLLSAGAASTSLPTADDYVFRVFPSNSLQAEKLITVASQLGHKTAAIIYINNDFGLDLAKTVKHEAAPAGIDILDMEGYKENVTDFSGQLERIKQKNPNVVFLLGYPKDMGQILKKAKESGINSEFLAPDTFDYPGVIESAGQAAEGIIYVLPDENFSNLFVANFKKKYKKQPNTVNALSYDSLKLLAQAIKNGSNDGAAIKAELYKIKDFPGVSGSITFDVNGNAINRPLAIKTIKEGKSVPYKK